MREGGRERRSWVSGRDRGLGDGDVIYGEKRKLLREGGAHRGKPGQQLPSCPGPRKAAGGEPWPQSSTVLPLPRPGSDPL